jgi:hypothetical protein
VEGHVKATLTVHHTNPSKEDEACNPWPHYGASYDDMINRCYWDYLRVYVPSGSQLFAGTAHPTSADLVITGQRQSGAVEVLPDEQDKAVFAAFFVLPRSQETETRFVYQLPEHALEHSEQSWRYRLLVQKQAGTRLVPLHVAVVLPPGASVQAVEASDVVQGEAIIRQPEQNVVHFDIVLERDHNLEVSFLLNER